MKPALVLQHLDGDGPAYLGRWLRREGLPFDLRNTEAGEDFPEHMHDHAALAILGGEMSANVEGEGFQCPEQTGKTRSCLTCGACWSTKKAVSFKEH